LAGHATSKQTLEVYSHLDNQDHAKLLGSLPVVPLAAGAALALQTGVAASPFVSTTGVEVGTVKSAGNKQKTPHFCGVSEVGRAGIEPATHGFSVRPLQEQGVRLK